jgi:hypothetical protein
MTDNLIRAKTYRIVDIGIAQSIADRGITVLEIIGLVTGLYNNHATMLTPVMWFTPKKPRSLGFAADTITIVGIFDADDWVAKTCICRFDELIEGAAGIGGPQLLYPHDIKIARTVNLPCLIDYFWESL